MSKEKVRGVSEIPTEGVVMICANMVNTQTHTHTIVKQTAFDWLQSQLSWPSPKYMLFSCGKINTSSFATYLTISGM